MQQNALTLIQSDVAFAIQSELEQILWKPCFYRRIEEFRRRIRKYASAVSSPDQRVRQHFVQVSNDFRQFLNESTIFYEQLHTFFRTSLEQPPQHHENDPEKREKNRQSCHRCLIFLGDLARYKELHNQKSKKDFTKAEEYYHKAIAVLPESGNPHNQLAVLATYSDAECIAVYRYCRSLMVPIPFATSLENLMLLFEKNRQRMASKAKTRTLYQTPIDVHSPYKDKSSKLRAFLEKVIYLYGILFTSTNAKLVYPREDQASLMKDFQELLAANGIGDALVLKLVIINIFLIVRLQKSAETAAGENASHAVSMFFDCSSQIIERILSGCNLAQLSSNASTGGGLPPSFRLLGPLGVCCDYLSTNPKLFLSQLNSHQSSSHFMAKLGLLAKKVDTAAILNEDFEFNLQMKQQLKETIELCGFLPLQNCEDECYSPSSNANASLKTKSSKKNTKANALPERIAMLARIHHLTCLYKQFNELRSPQKPIISEISAAPKESSQNTTIDEESHENNNEDHEMTNSGNDEDEDEVIVFRPQQQSQNQMRGFEQLSGSPPLTQQQTKQPHASSSFNTCPMDFTMPGSSSSSLFGHSTSTTAEPFSMFGTGFGWSSSTAGTTASSSSTTFNIPSFLDSTMQELEAIENHTNLYEAEESRYVPIACVCVGAILRDVGQYI